MTYRYQSPIPVLAPYVRTILEIDTAAFPTSSDLPIFTNGMPAMVCKTETNPDHQPQHIELMLFGTSVPGDYFNLTDGSSITTFFFKPFAMPAIFNLAASKLLKEPIDLFDLMKSKSTSLHEQLRETHATASHTDVLNDFLFQQLKRNRRQCEIIQTVTDQLLVDTVVSLTTIQEQLNITERTLQRMFKKFVGISPAQYRRICQFHQSFDQLKEGEYDKLTDVVYDNGFADQSHFNRTFKEYTEITPGAYLRSGLKPKTE
ncbi:MAG: AraC family transcriptional regulator [Chitinophagaceae bacterium]|nr:AraC family transcriptional regulator [Chitinophagaceae bacterium]